MGRQRDRANAGGDTHGGVVGEDFHEDHKYERTERKQLF